jgi:ATP-dependent RNA helicase TDRD9
LDRVVLQAKQLNIGEPKSILALAFEPPNLNDIEVTILKLKEVLSFKSFALRVDRSKSL